MITLALALMFAAPPRFALVIGHNAPPPETELAPLSYADDDAVTTAELLAATGANVTLLSVLDAETQSLHPEWAEKARAPTLSAIRAAVEMIVAASSGGERAEVWISFSGHGFVRDGQPALTLLDGALTREILADELLPRLEHCIVHVVVDACHAADLLQSRGGDAKRASLSEDERARIVQTRVLDRFPNVGVLIASSTRQQTHEWSRYQRGVFSYLLQSALRGGADIDGDGSIGYLEASAFATAATRDIRDVAARPRIIALAPKLDVRAPLVRWPEGEPRILVRSSDDHVTVADERGVAFATVFAEPGYEVQLRVPAAGAYRVIKEGAIERVARLVMQVMRPSEVSEAGPFEETLARRDGGGGIGEGWYAVAFGPAYFRGYSDPMRAYAEPIQAVRPPRRKAAAGMWIAAGAFAASAAILGGFAAAAADAHNATLLERPAAEAEGRYLALGTAALITGALAVASAAAGFAIFDWGAPAQ